MKEWILVILQDKQYFDLVGRLKTFTIVGIVGSRSPVVMDTIFVLQNDSHVIIEPCLDLSNPSEEVSFCCWIRE